MECIFCKGMCVSVTGAEGLYVCTECGEYTEDEIWEETPPPKQFKTKLRRAADG